MFNSFVYASLKDHLFLAEVIKPTWSEASRSPGGDGGEGSRRPSGKESCLLVLSLLWPSAAPVSHNKQL